MTISFNICPSDIQSTELDPRVNNAVQEKISETLTEIGEIITIERSLEGLLAGDSTEFAFGIAAGRIYNSFHYQTRRILKRDATENEFQEFLEILSNSAPEIRSSIRREQQNKHT